jgi:amidohydrolase
MRADRRDDDDPGSLFAQAQALQPRTVALRRALHRQPEQGLQLPRTQQAVLTELADLPVTVRTGHAVSSVLAVLEGDAPGPTVLLRGDMDALPLTEATSLPFASRVEGSMHACGHDMHVAMLVSAARVLAERRGELAGRVLFMFQPGEEGYHGARYMIEEGLLEVAGPPEQAFALHISATRRAGLVVTRPGAIMASGDVMRVTVTGRGGHAAAPHDALDPVPAAAAMVGALNTMITRRYDTVEPTVLTIAHIRAGTTSNVIPETAFLEGTVRAISDEVRRRLLADLQTVCQHTAAAYGCRAAVEIQPGYPVTMNDAAAAERVERVTGQVLGAESFEPMPTPIMGAEDFSYVLSRVPGAMAFLGGCPPEQDSDSAPPNHSNRVVFDEPAMACGVAMYAGLALDVLR